MQRYSKEKKYSTGEEETEKIKLKKLGKDDWHKMPIGDSADIINPLLNKLYKKSDSPLPEEHNTSSSETGYTKQNWKSYGYNDETYTPARNRSYIRGSCSTHSKTSFTKSPEGVLSSSQTATPSLLMRSATFRPTSNSLFPENQINYITLIGFGMGLLLSKVLQYLLVYFNWLLRQVKQLRQVFLGNGSIMDFFNFDDNPRYDLRIKLLIMPVLAICCFLYFLVAMLHYAIRLLLADVPTFLMAMVHKVYLEI